MESVCENIVDCSQQNQAKEHPWDTGAFVGRPGQGLSCRYDNDVHVIE